MTPRVLAAIEATVDTDRRLVPDDAELLAVGWTTVELERAASQLELEAADGPADVALGARCRIGQTAEGLRLVLLEPATEGRLVRSLARLGEGPAVTWWEVDAIDPTTAFAPTEGPFGTARLLRDGSVEGHFRFLRTRQAATISG